MDEQNYNESAQPKSQAAGSHKNSAQSTSNNGDPVPNAQHGGKGELIGLPITKGETYGDWAINVTVPTNWTEAQDRDELRSQEVKSADELVNQIGTWMNNLHGILTLAFCYITDTPFDPEDGIFIRLPLKGKVEVLRALFYQESQETEYLEGFDSDLRRFVEFETICVPILERYCLNTKSIWLRQLSDVLDALILAVHDFDESLCCEHPDCPKFAKVVYNRS